MCVRVRVRICVYVECVYVRAYVVQYILFRGCTLYNIPSHVAYSLLLPCHV